MKTIPTLLCDFYKVAHREQYPDKTEIVYSTWTPRSYTHMPVAIDKSIVYGFQGFVKEYLIDFFNTEFFARPKADIVAEYARYIKHCLFVETPYTKHIEDLYDLGYLPLEIKALEEGTRVKARTPTLAMWNTEPEFFWLTNYFETMMSSELWKPATVATLADIYRNILNEYAVTTTGSTEGVEFQGHDFSMRGLSNAKDVSTSGHLLSFVGTDTIPAIQYLEQYYNANIEKELVGCSVNATEHSVMSCSGNGEGQELETFRRLLEDVYPSGIISIVSDTWDLWKVLTEYMPKLKDKILARTGSPINKVVVRPDCYDDQTEILTPNGWQYFKDLPRDEKVAQVLDDGTLEYVIPTKHYAEDYEGEMCYFQDTHGKLDLLVTPNHRMIYKKKGEWFVQEACKAGVTGYYGKNMLRSAKNSHSEEMTAFDKFRIAYQADGSRQSNHAKNEGAISNHITYRFNFAKQRKIDHLIAICEEGGFEYKLSQEPARKGQAVFYVKIPVDYSIADKELAWVNPYTRGGDWCDQFCEEVAKWDSCIRNSGRFKYDSTNKKAASVVADTAIMAGRGAYISEYEDTRSDKYSNVFTVHVMRDNKLGGQSCKKSAEYYRGKVYCVQVPTGRLVVRRNKCTLVCGNSGDPVNIICGLHIPEFKTVEEATDTLYDGIMEEAGQDCEGAHCCGDGEYTKKFKVAGKYYEYTQEVSYDRHDKTYYYVDMYGYEKDSVTEFEPKPSDLGVIELLWNEFGGTVNDQGYKVLNPAVGAIYGDAITPARCTEICERLKAKGFASTNMVFGIGSFTYQYITRDTLGFAMKATWTRRDGVGYNITKDPVTDDGTKKSAKGRVSVEGAKDIAPSTVDEQTDYYSEHDLMKPLFRDGKLLRETSLQEIRDRVAQTR